MKYGFTVPHHHPILEATGWAMVRAAGDREVARSGSPKLVSSTNRAGWGMARRSLHRGVWTPVGSAPTGPEPGREGRQAAPARMGAATIGSAEWTRSILVAC